VRDHVQKADKPNDHVVETWCVIFFRRRGDGLRIDVVVLRKVSRGGFEGKGARNEDGENLNERTDFVNNYFNEVEVSYVARPGLVGFGW
jgi:hypothetical protein